MRYVIIAVMLLVAYVIINFSITRRIPSLTLPKRISNVKPGVPRVIFRTYGNLTVSKPMYNYCHYEWKRLNPEYIIVWFSNKQCDRFMEKVFPHLFDTYQMLKPGAYKADLWRLCVLYHFGGIYVDAFATPHQPLDKMLQNCWSISGRDQFIAPLDPPFSGSGVHNGFMVASKHHPFLKQCIDDIVLNVKNKYYGESSLAITGPICLRKSINKVLNHKCKFRLGKNIHGPLTFYLLMFQWGPRQYVFRGDTILLSKKYSFLSWLYEKIVKRGKGHNYLWVTRDAFSK
jgi:hypothetical protein